MNAVPDQKLQFAFAGFCDPEHPLLRRARTGTEFQANVGFDERDKLVAERPPMLSRAAMFRVRAIHRRVGESRGHTPIKSPSGPPFRQTLLERVA